MVPGDDHQHQRIKILHIHPWIQQGMFRNVLLCSREQCCVHGGLSVPNSPRSRVRVVHIPPEGGNDFISFSTAGGSLWLQGELKWTVLTWRTFKREKTICIHLEGVSQGKAMSMMNFFYPILPLFNTPSWQIRLYIIYRIFPPAVSWLQFYFRLTDMD